MPRWRRNWRPCATNWKTTNGRSSATRRFRPEILNRNFRTSGKIKGSDNFGSISWDGVSYEYLTLSEIPKYAEIHAGDTIVTTSHSSIFPPDVMIGTVESFALNNATYYDVKVRLHTDIAALNNVSVVKYLDAEEIDMLEQSLGVPPSR